MGYWEVIVIVASAKMYVRSWQLTSAHARAKYLQGSCWRGDSHTAPSHEDHRVAATRDTTTATALGLRACYCKHKTSRGSLLDALACNHKPYCKSQDVVCLPHPHQLFRLKSRLESCIFITLHTQSPLQRLSRGKI